MNHHRQNLLLLALLAITVSASAQCGKSPTTAQGQSKSEPRIAAGAVPMPGPALQGKAAGEVLPFAFKNKSLKTSLLNHPMPELWLSFPVQGNQGKQQSASPGKNESTVRVELPVKARKLLAAHWKTALTYNYNTEITRPPNGDIFHRQMVEMANSYLNVQQALMKIEIEAPDGRRMISHDEAQDLGYFLNVAAVEVAEQAKKYKTGASAPSGAPL
jgi:hypothetical protein